jgi:membrane protein DedA with SNARE-associated domain
VTLELTPLISTYGVWLVAVFIALESIGLPLPAEAALIAAAFFAARTHELNIWILIAAGVPAAIVGDILGFWIGKLFGYQLLVRYGNQLGLTEGRIKVGQWLFVQYGGIFVFTARFLPFLRNMAAVLAGTHCMAQRNFYLASGMAAVTWVMGYGLAAYSYGEAFTNLASPAAISLGVAGLFIMLWVPMLIVRYEKRLCARLPSPQALAAPLMRISE